MDTPKAGRTAALIIRLWTEGEPSRGFRARVTRTLDVTRHEEISTVTTSKQEIDEIVSGWIESFLSSTGTARTEGLP